MAVWAERAKRTNEELGARDWLGFVLGRLDAGKNELRMESRQMGTWGEDGREGERKGLGRMWTELRWVRRLVVGGRKKLERWMGWCVQGISKRVRRGWEGRANERLD